LNADETSRHSGILTDLIELRVPLSDGVAAVRTLPWDSAVDLVVIARSHLIRLLQRYLDGSLSAAEIDAWANAVESREDIGLDARDEATLHRFIFELANPSLSEPISRRYAHDLLAQIQVG
jgi:hypothetical protein